MSTPKIRPSDYPFAGTPTATPRTDAVAKKIGTIAANWFTRQSHALDFIQQAEDALEDARTLETELAAASQAYDCAMAIHGTVLEDLAAEREKVRVLREALALAAESGELTGWYFQQARAALAAMKEEIK